MRTPELTIVNSRFHYRQLLHQPANSTYVTGAPDEQLGLSPSVRTYSRICTDAKATRWDRGRTREFLVSPVGEKSVAPESRECRDVVPWLTTEALSNSDVLRIPRTPETDEPSDCCTEEASLPRDLCELRPFLPLDRSLRFTLNMLERSLWAGLLVNLKRERASVLWV